MIISYDPDVRLITWSNLPSERYELDCSLEISPNDSLAGRVAYVAMIDGTALPASGSFLAADPESIGPAPNQGPYATGIYESPLLPGQWGLMDQTYVNYIETGVFDLDPTEGDTVTEPDPDPNNHYNPTATENRFTGLYPDNDYPLVDGQLDFEQEKRRQARVESDRTPRVSSDDPYPPHPPFTEKGPDATLAEATP